MRGRLFFIIVFIIFYLPTFQKYVIWTKTTTSPLSVFINKHIYLTNKGFNTLKTQQNAICIALQCIELLCILVTSLALPCITLLSLALLCIELLCITLQCIFVLPIAHQGIPDTHRKDPNFFANVRTWPLTDFIDFLGLKSVLFSLALVLRYVLYYERSNDA